MLQHIYLSLSFVKLRKKDDNDIVALLEHKDSFKLVCVDSYKKCCYPILVDLILDYKEQVCITGIKENMQCLICHILPKKREFINRL